MIVTVSSRHMDVTAALKAYALRKAGRSAARSAMSSPSPYVEDTTARSIAAAMKPDGGKPLDLIRPLQPARCGWTRIRWRQLRTKCFEVASIAAVGTDERSAKSPAELLRRIRT